MEPRGRVKLQNKVDTQEKGRVLLFSLLCIILRYWPVECINKEIKGEPVMVVLYKFTCIWKAAAAFGCLLEQQVLAQFQKMCEAGTKMQKLLSY